MPLTITERRGFNREDAISYLGVKGTFFDKELRPKLNPKKMGTSLIFDRIELDKLFDAIMLQDGDVGSTSKGVTQWPKESQEFSKPKMDGGGLIRHTKASDFKAALQHIKRQKSG